MIFWLSSNLFWVDLLSTDVPLFFPLPQSKPTMGSGVSKPKTTTASKYYTNNVVPPSQLQCTVRISKTNAQVPFVSSVKEAETAAKNTQAITSRPVSPRSTVFRCGDVEIDLETRQREQIERSNAVLSTFGDVSKDTAVEIGDMLLPLHKAYCFPLKGGPAYFPSRTQFAVPTSYSYTSCGGQSAPIRAMSSSADGQQVVVVVTGHKQCYYMDSSTGTTMMVVRGHTDSILSCCHSRDSKFLITSSSDGTAVLWDLNNSKKLREVPLTSQSNVVAVNDDSEVIATTCTEHFVHLWEAKSCDPLVTFQRHTAAIYSVAFCRRGGFIASGAGNGDVFVWIHSTGDARFQFSRHRTPVIAVSFSHDGQRLLTVDRELLAVWDLFTGQPVFGRDTTGNILSGSDEVFSKAVITYVDAAKYTTACFAAGNLIVAACVSKQVLILDPNEGREVLSVETRAIVTCLATSWSGCIILLGDLAGNVHKLQLQFSQRDFLAFSMNSKPTNKEKLKIE